MRGATAFRLLCALSLSHSPSHGAPSAKSGAVRLVSTAVVGAAAAAGALTLTKQRSAVAPKELYNALVGETDPTPMLAEKARVCLHTPTEAVRPLSSSLTPCLAHLLWITHPDGGRQCKVRRWQPHGRVPG